MAYQVLASLLASGSVVERDELRLAEGTLCHCAKIGEDQKYISRIALKHDGKEQGCGRWPEADACQGGRSLLLESSLSYKICCVSKFRQIAQPCRIRHSRRQG